jgi:hypothetical protein
MLTFTGGISEYREANLWVYVFELADSNMCPGFETEVRLTQRIEKREDLEAILTSMIKLHASTFACTMAGMIETLSEELSDETVLHELARILMFNRSSES